MRKAWLLVLAVFLGGCVSVPVEETSQPSAGAPRPGFILPLSAGAREVPSLHFTTMAYSPEKAARFSALAEKYYEKIMQETMLYSFVPKKPYEIICYDSREEYLQKTGQPLWSGAVTAANTIGVYNSPESESALAHEITHIIINEFMGDARQKYRWLSEGLATYIEAGTFAPEKLRLFRENAFRSTRVGFMPFAQMTAFAPREGEQAAVGVWYMQNYLLAEYIIRKGGKLGLSIFITRVRDGYDIDGSLRSAYPGLWRDFNALESSFSAYVRNGS